MDHNHEDHDHDHKHGGNGGGGCCSDGGHDHGHHGDVVAGPGDDVVTCAVMGNPTVRSRAEASGLVRDFEGERYYFCCGHCAETFDADPLAYTAA
ncbi:YHS domain-containing protein [Georgenia muralis]|uniref:YHS domain-containing protein n=1 Tax=Georgenia muralis TaxID=154117 RepID=A0A3N4Z8D8_9MICO|nr:YHS domain-containing protein [Georgenia muralis]RPF28274.1 YHS domain-containing protein [Georgenia muralis]